MHLYRAECTSDAEAVIVTLSCSRQSAAAHGLNARKSLLRLESAGLLLLYYNTRSSFKTDESMSFKITQN